MWCQNFELLWAYVKISDLCNNICLAKRDRNIIHDRQTFFYILREILPTHLQTFGSSLHVSFSTAIIVTLVVKLWQIQKTNSTVMQLLHFLRHQNLKISITKAIGGNDGMRLYPHIFCEKLFFNQKFFLSCGFSYIKFRIPKWKVETLPITL